MTVCALDLSCPGARRSDDGSRLARLAESFRPCESALESVRRRVGVLVQRCRCFRELGHGGVGGGSQSGGDPCSRGGHGGSRSRGGGPGPRLPHHLPAGAPWPPGGGSRPRGGSRWEHGAGGPHHHQGHPPPHGGGGAASESDSWAPAPAVRPPRILALPEDGDQRAINSLLNKVTRSNFDRICQKILESTSEENLAPRVDAISLKSYDDPTTSEVMVDLLISLAARGERSLREEAARLISGRARVREEDVEEEISPVRGADPRDEYVAFCEEKKAKRSAILRGGVRASLASHILSSGGAVPGDAPHPDPPESILRAYSSVLARADSNEHRELLMECMLEILSRVKARTPADYPRLLSGGCLRDPYRDSEEVSPRYRFLASQIPGPAGP